MNAVRTMCSVVQSCPCGLISGLGTKMLYVLWPKHRNIKNRSSIVTNLIKTLKKWSRLKKKSRKKKRNLSRQLKKEANNHIKDAQAHE